MTNWTLMSLASYAFQTMTATNTLIKHLINNNISLELIEDINLLGKRLDDLRQNLLYQANQELSEKEVELLHQKNLKDFIVLLERLLESSNQIIEQFTLQPIHEIEEIINILVLFLEARKGLKD